MRSGSHSNTAVRAITLRPFEESSIGLSQSGNMIACYLYLRVPIFTEISCAPLTPPLAVYGDRTSHGRDSGFQIEQERQAFARSITAPSCRDCRRRHRGLQPPDGNR